MNQHRIGGLGETAKIDQHPAVGTERRIQCSVGVEASKSELLLHTEIKHCRARGDDLSVGLERGVVGDVEIVVAKIDAHFSAGTECRVESSVAQITRSREVVVIKRAIGRANGDNFSVRLNQDRIDIVLMPEKIGRYRAAVTKGRVEASIRVVPRQGKIGIGHVALG